jgi:predicted enzyme related to lactoylglutathione lyase
MIMKDELKIKMYAFTLDSKEPYALAKFYATLLHWDIPYTDDEYTYVCAPGTAQGEYPGITIQKNPDFLPPIWPAKPDAQQQMAHLDFAVNDLEQAVSYAVECGAKISEAQFSDSWKVLFDPEGHPFCLCNLHHIFHTEKFGLL